MSNQPTPSYAVIFTSRRTDVDAAGYAQTSEHMKALAARMPGYLGMESASGTDGCGITVSYWETLEAVARWRAEGDHQTAQAAGRQRWYQSYTVRICRVERKYEFTAPD